MTIAERFRMEGIERGIEKEKAAIAKRLLAEQIDIAFISKVTQLTIAEIKHLEENTH